MNAHQESKTHQIAWFQCYLKVPKYSIFSEIVPEYSSNQDSHLRKPTLPKVTHYAQERAFPWHTSATCPECAPIHLVPHGPSNAKLLGLVPIKTCSTLLSNEYTWGKQKKREKNTISVPSIHWNWNHEGMVSDRILSKFMHYAQETSPWNMCTAVPLAL